MEPTAGGFFLYLGVLQPRKERIWHRESEVMFVCGVKSESSRQKNIPDIISIMPSTRTNYSCFVLVF